MKENKMGNTGRAFTEFLLKSHTQNCHPTSLQKRMWGREIRQIIN